MGLTRGVYLNDVEDSLLTQELLLRKVDSKRCQECDSVPKLVRACVRYVILKSALKEVSLVGSQ